MGQYHKLYNLDRKEFVHPHQIGNGVKLMEQVGARKSTATALFLLVANSNGEGGRGGGDARSSHPFIGRWAGQRVVVQGDYAEETDQNYTPGSELEQFTNVSSQVQEMLNDVFAIYD